MPSLSNVNAATPVRSSPAWLLAYSDVGHDGSLEGGRTLERGG